MLCKCSSACVDIVMIIWMYLQLMRKMMTAAMIEGRRARSRHHTSHPPRNPHPRTTAATSPRRSRPSPLRPADASVTTAETVTVVLSERSTDQYVTDDWTLNSMMSSYSTLCTSYSI